MKSIVENLAFDQIYHEHLLYYTVSTIRKLLKRHGLDAFDAYVSPIHGGSVDMYASHEGAYPESHELRAIEQEEERAGANTLEWYHRFAERVQAMKEQTIKFLNEKKPLAKRYTALVHQLRATPPSHWHSVPGLPCREEPDASRTLLTWYAHSPYP